MADSLAEALSPSTMMAILGETGFGRVWAIHIGFVIALSILTGLDRWGRHSPTILITALSGGCLASLALTGHTQEQEGLAFLLRVATDGAHLFAAGAWLGGLVALLVLLPSRPTPGNRPEGEIGHVLMRFSGMGYGAVAILVGTGLINTWYLVPSLSQLTSSLYGQLLIIKLGLDAVAGRYEQVLGRPSYCRSTGREEPFPASQSRYRRTGSWRTHHWSCQCAGHLGSLRRLIS